MAPNNSRTRSTGVKLTASLLHRYRVSDLQRECRASNLSAAGNLPDLVDRLRPFVGQAPPRQ
eukprot:2575176-Rhodomonas_salina.1